MPPKYTASQLKSKIPGRELDQHLLELKAAAAMMKRSMEEADEVDQQRQRQRPRLEPGGVNARQGEISSFVVSR